MVPEWHTLLRHAADAAVCNGGIWGLKVWGFIAEWRTLLGTQLTLLSAMVPFWKPEGQMQL